MAMAFGNLTIAGWALESGDYATVPATPFIVDGTPFFPLGVYHFPQGIDPDGKFEEIAEAGFNMALLPVGTAKEELDAAHRSGVRVMVSLGSLLRLSGEEGREERETAIRERLGPGSIIHEHPAVFAVEQPDEPLWVEKGAFRDRTPLEVFTWARPPEERTRVHQSIRQLKDGYASLREVSGDRYQVWLNFAPRGSETELRWFTALPAGGGYPPDPRPAADAFGTDVYPVPDGGGNNGWVNARIARSPSAVGVFTDRLRRAVAPHPIYMVLQGCGIGEWNRNAGREHVGRRPTLAESRLMAFQSIIHGARGILYWGTTYIEADSEFWGDLKRVAGEVAAFAPMLLTGDPWPEALVGTSRLESLALTCRGFRCVLLVNAGDWAEARVCVPGWRGNRAFSLLDGGAVPVENGVLLDQIPPLEVRIYSESEAFAPLFAKARAGGARE